MENRGKGAEGCLGGRMSIGSGLGGWAGQWSKPKNRESLIQETKNDAIKSLLHLCAGNEGTGCIWNSRGNYPE